MSVSGGGTTFGTTAKVALLFSFSFVYVGYLTFNLFLPFEQDTMTVESAGVSPSTSVAMWTDW